MELNQLAQKIYKANVEKGFYEDYNDIKAVLSGVNNNLLPVFERFVTAQRLALITSEVSEVLEANRKGVECPLIDSVKESMLNKSKDEDFKTAFQECVKDTQEDEMADIIIRCLDFCGSNNIDIDFHIKAKMKYNSLRPYKHGKKY
jgi:NTP pyrophosphatase (non-canonical NTP hydrolase)